jgi:two-component system, response regulator PdtaR
VVATNGRFTLLTVRLYSRMPAMSPPRILVVEDESFVRALIVERLAEAGFEVDQADTSDAAVRLLDADGYKLLVTDMHLPGALNGAELAERSHKKKSDLPVVFVHGRHEVVRRLEKAGIRSEVLPAPFALDELVGIVQRLTGVVHPAP